MDKSLQEKFGTEVFSAKVGNELYKEHIMVMIYDWKTYDYKIFECSIGELQVALREKKLDDDIIITVLPIDEDFNEGVLGLLYEYEAKKRYIKNTMEVK